MGPEILLKYFPLPHPTGKFPCTRHVIFFFFLQSKHEAVITIEGIFKNNLCSLKNALGTYKQKVIPPFPTIFSWCFRRLIHSILEYTSQG